MTYERMTQCSAIYGVLRKRGRATVGDLIDLCHTHYPHSRIAEMTDPQGLVYLHEGGRWNATGYRIKREWAPLPGNRRMRVYVMEKAAP